MKQNRIRILSSMDIPKTDSNQNEFKDKQHKDLRYQEYNKKIQACQLNKSNQVAFSGDNFSLKQTKTNREFFLQQIEQNEEIQFAKKSEETNNFVIVCSIDNSKQILKKYSVQQLIDKLCGVVEFEIFIHNIQDKIKEKITKCVDNSIVLSINDQQPTSRLSYYQQRQIKNIQKLNIQNIEDEFIVKVYGQTQNGVREQIKWQIIQSKCIKQFQQQAIQNNIIIESVPLKNLYKLQYTADQKVDFDIYQKVKRFHQSFQNQIEQIVILIYQCKNINEADQLAYILNNQVMISLFNKELQTKEIIIDSFSNIQDKQLMEIQCDHIFAVFFNYLDFPLNELQQTFENIIKNESFIKTKMQLMSEQLKTKSEEQLDNICLIKSSLNKKEKNIDQFEQQSNCLQLTIELLKKELSNQQRNELKDIIKFLSGSEQIQNPLENLLNQLKQIILQYPKHLEISYFKLNVPPKFINQKLDIYDNKQNYKRCFLQINHERQSEILNEMKIIIFYWKIMPLLLQKASQYGIDIDLDVKNYQYVLSYHIESTEITQFCTQFQWELRHSRILIQQCSSKEEAISKYTLLSTYQTDSLLIDTMQNYPIDKIPSEIKNMVRKYYQQNALIYIFFGVENIDQISIDAFQEEINTINSEIKHCQDKSQIIYSDYLLYITEINYEIEKINTENIHVQVLDPYYDYSQGKYYYQIIFNTWVLRKQAEFKRANLCYFQQQVANILNTLIYRVIANQKTVMMQIHSKLWKYLCEKQKQLIDDIQWQNQCRLDVESSQENVSKALTKFDNKELLIRQGDITQEICDSIIINLNSDFLAKVLNLGGPQFGEQIIQMLKSKEKPLEGNLYALKNSSTIKYIISYPSIADKDVEQYQIQIKNIFKIADQIKMKKIVISIPIKDQDVKLFQQASNIIIKELLLQIQTSKYVESIVIIEENSIKIDSFIGVLKNIIYEKRFIQYQWQWWDDYGWTDYDDFEISQQIDEAYEHYQRDNKLNEIKIVLPVTKYPGTHIVDFQKMILTDLRTEQIQNISITQRWNYPQYNFNGQPVSECLNQYLNQQSQKGIKEFQIFYKQLKVAFSKNKILQYNLATNYQREVRINQGSIAKQFIFEQINQNEDIQNQIDSQEWRILYIKGLSQSNIDRTKQSIQDLINQSTTLFYWKVINNNDYEFKYIKQEIVNSCIYYTEQIIEGQNIQFCCKQSKAKKLEEFLKMVKQTYPINWIHQYSNMILVELCDTDEEYQKVSSLFLKSYKDGKIYQINRIQNKLLYENYHDEKQKLIKIRQLEGYQLTQNELERYVWHGVRGQHPQIIYSSNKNAFDITFSQAGMWGQGIYFAENSIYSKGFSYQLTPQESQQQYDGKSIFLLCLLTTGKVIELSSDISLKRPPDGYDCVQGNTGGSDIFVLYGMDVRRAYPAYEIIFE